MDSVSFYNEPWCAHVERGGARYQADHLFTLYTDSLETADLGEIQRKECCKEVSVWQLHRTPPQVERTLPEPRRPTREKDLAMFVSVCRYLSYCSGASGGEFTIQMSSRHLEL